MFSITDNERLRDAYALLMFMQRDISASAEKKAAVKNLAATVKMEIRATTTAPFPMCALSVPTMTAVWSLFSCPISWTRRTRWTLPTGFLTIII